MEQDRGTSDNQDIPDKSRRSFLAGAASFLAGAALSPADALAKAAQSIKPVSQLSKAEAKALLDSVDKNTLAVMVMLESGGDPNARNPNSNVWGAYQFLSSTATSVGLDPSERGDPYLSLLGAARLQKRNADFLKDNLGRAPKPYEVYLAHQQGAAGAVALLKGGNRNAIDVLDDLKNVSSSVARQAIVNNGGKSNTTAAEFVQIVQAFYNKSATSQYSFPAGQKWVAHVAEHQGLSKEFLASDPYFSRKRIREAKRAPNKPPQVDNPDTDLRTYSEMLEYLLINPNSKWAKDFPLATNVINRAWGSSGDPSQPAPPAQPPKKREPNKWVERLWGSDGADKGRTR